MPMTTSLSASNDIAGKSVLPAAGKYVSQTALVGLAYFVAGRLGLAVPYTSGNVSPVWPASGVALSALLLLGYRVCRVLHSALCWLIFSRRFRTSQPLVLRSETHSLP